MSVWAPDGYFSKKTNSWNSLTCHFSSHSQKHTPFDSQISLLGIYPTDRLVYMAKRYLPTTISFGIVCNSKILKNKQKAKKKKKNPNPLVKQIMAYL